MGLVAEVWTNGVLGRMKWRQVDRFAKNILSTGEVQNVQNDV